MVSNEAGFDRAKMIQPEVMAPPLVWLVSDAAGKVTGRRFLGVHWDPALPPNKRPRRLGHRSPGPALDDANHAEPPVGDFRGLMIHDAVH
jgi:hypothetical protein